jgi:hypothetical protein
MGTSRGLGAAAGPLADGAAADAAAADAAALDGGAAADDVPEPQPGNASPTPRPSAAMPTIRVILSVKRGKFIAVPLAP